jgi:hypothetical protein
MNARYKVIFPLLITFLVLTVVIFSAKIFYAGRGMDYNVLMGANCLFFLVSLLVFRIQFNAMHHSNPNVFIRSVMWGLIIKMFTCIAAVVVYYFSAGENFNKPAVYVSMVIYMIFLVVEVRTIMKLNKQKNA